MAYIALYKADFLSFSLYTLATIIYVSVAFINIAYITLALLLPLLRYAIAITLYVDITYGDIREGC